jgi:hypothetical protein
MRYGHAPHRIAQARALLQERLTRRGVMLSAALTAGVMWNQSRRSTALPSRAKPNGCPFFCPGRVGRTGMWLGTTLKSRTFFIAPGHWMICRSNTQPRIRRPWQRGR